MLIQYADGGKERGRGGDRTVKLMEFVGNTSMMPQALEKISRETFNDL